MSTSAVVGSYIDYTGKQALVVRIVESTTYFQDVSTEGEEDHYLLAERYAELRVEGELEPKFLIFNSQRFPIVPTQPMLLKGLDPKVWKRCP